jgi:hypothetical protein
LQELKGAMAEIRRDRSAADETTNSMRVDLAETIGAAADRLETLHQRFAGRDTTQRR